MTVKEFIKECEVYHYSQENYDFMKECMELELLNQYIKKQEYLSENYDELIGSDEAMFKESYFGESLDYSDLENLNEKFTDKLGKIWESIKSFFKKIFKPLINFLSKKKDEIVAKFEPDKKYTLSEGYVQRVKENFKKLSNDEKTMLQKDFDFKKKIKFNYTKGSEKLTKDEEKFLLIGLLNGFNLKYNVTEGMKQPISLSFLEKINDVLEKRSDNIIKSIMDLIDQGVAESKRKGLEFSFTEKDHENFIDSLKDILNFVDSKEFGNLFINASMDNVDYKNIADIQQVISLSISISMQIYKIRMKSITLGVEVKKQQDGFGGYLDNPDSKKKESSDSNKNKNKKEKSFE